jgi:hypothetical protein
MRTTLIGLALLGLVGCSGHEVAPVEDGPGSTVTLYCYETLADPGCYLLPDPGRGDRLLGIVDVPWTPEIALIASPDADGE